MGIRIRECRFEGAKCLIIHHVKKAGILLRNYQYSPVGIFESLALKLFDLL